MDLKAGLSKKLEGGVLQAAFGNADADFHRATPEPEVGVLTTIALVKHDRVPSWQTTPAPSTLTRSNKVSRSQSVLAERSRNLLPEVSPFVQRVLRLRL